MKKSSSAVALILVSAIALPFGCSQQCNEKLADGRPNPNCHGAAQGGRGGGHGIVTHPGSHSGKSGFSSTPRGGFGASAGSHAGG